MVLRQQGKLPLGLYTTWPAAIFLCEVGETVELSKYASNKGMLPM